MSISGLGMETLITVRLFTFFVHTDLHVIQLRTFFYLASYTGADLLFWVCLSACITTFLRRKYVEEN